MKKRLILTFLCLTYLVSSAQKGRPKSAYISFIKKFYASIDKPTSVKDAKVLFGEETVDEYEEVIFFENCKDGEHNCSVKFEAESKNESRTSLLFIQLSKELDPELKIYSKSGTPNILCDSVTEEIDQVIFKVRFENKYILYFSLNAYKDEAIHINDVYLPNGSSIFNSQKQKANSTFLEIPGYIKDKDGYVNIRQKPDLKSKVVGTIKEGEKIHYTPNADSSWWRVLKEDVTIFGYISSDRIVKKN